MKYHFIHALVLTPFESSLTTLNWEEVIAQDYPVHALYCKELKCLLFLSNNQKSDCSEMVSFLKQTFEILSIPAQFKKQIIILSDDENELNEQDVLRHFN